MSPNRAQGQLVLIGTPNVGKSQIIASFTKAKPAVVSPTPYTTQEPSVGMLGYENIQFQLVDTPPITQDFVQPWVFDLVRNADLVWLVVSLASDEILDQVEIVESRLTEAKIQTTGVTEAANDADEMLEANFTKTTLLIANQADEEGAADRLEILQRILRQRISKSIRFLRLPAKGLIGYSKWSSIKQLEYLPRLHEISQPNLSITRILSCFRMGARLLKRRWHCTKSSLKSFKTARIWGANWYDGQTVSRDDVVYDGDVLEFHL